MVDSLATLKTQGLSGSIYTQPYDVESEQNGLMTYDREIVKLPIAEFRQINARLWPTTANATSVTRDVVAKVADSVTVGYENRLAEYTNGRRDTAFLRTLSLMAIAKRDGRNVVAIGGAYIAQMQDPFTKQNLEFIKRVALTTRDTAFAILYHHAAKVDSVLGKDQAEATTTAVIERELILPNVPETGLAAWETIERDVVARYGTLGEEIVSQARVIQAAKHGDWASFGRVATSWFEKYGRRRSWISPAFINSVGWAAFSATADTSALSAAATMMQHAITIDSTAGLVDTYANLLYKLGRKDDALRWEEKAVASDPANEEISATLAKMRRGEPTWPQ